MDKPDIQIQGEYEVANGDVFLEVTIGNGTSRAPRGVTAVRVFR